MDPLHHLPIAEIAPHALLRDRTALEPSALHLLQHSIATEGLRTPIEVWQLSTPRDHEDGQHKYGLISGLRRLTACRALGHPTIPALPRTTRTRIRNHVSVVEALAPLLTDPTSLTTRQLDTLAAAIQSGHEDLLVATLHPVIGQGSETQWSTLRPVLMDVLREPTNPTTRRPRRLLKLRQGLTITREPTPSGWILRFTGPQAKSPGLADDVMTKVEEWFSLPEND